MTKAEDEYNILNRAIDVYGAKAQEDMMIEEMSELTKALLKHRRNPTEGTLENIIEEIVDVGIVLDQMKIIYGDNKAVRLAKIERLNKRLNEQTGGGT